VRERAFGSLKYEHLHGHDITDGPMIAVEAERYRQVFNTVRPHEALGMSRPAERYLPSPRPSTCPTYRPQVTCICTEQCWLSLL
jgi:transposase InsO family protein